MITRRKLAAGLGGLALMLGTLGGAAAVHAAPPAMAPNAVAQQGAQVEDGQPDGTEATSGPDTDNLQQGSGQQVEDGAPDTPGAATP
jgi:hypothetical protein